MIRILRRVRTEPVCKILWKTCSHSTQFPQLFTPVYPFHGRYINPVPGTRDRAGRSPLNPRFSNEGPWKNSGKRGPLAMRGWHSEGLSHSPIVLEPRKFFSAWKGHGLPGWPEGAEREGPSIRIIPKEMVHLPLPEKLDVGRSNRMNGSISRGAPGRSKSVVYPSGANHPQFTKISFTMDFTRKPSSSGMLTLFGELSRGIQGQSALMPGRTPDRFRVTSAIRDGHDKGESTVQRGSRAQDVPIMAGSLSRGKTPGSLLFGIFLGLQHLVQFLGLVF